MHHNFSAQVSVSARGDYNADLPDKLKALTGANEPN